MDKAMRRQVSFQCWGVRILHHQLLHYPALGEPIGSMGLHMYEQRFICQAGSVNLLITSVHGMVAAATHQ